MMCQLSVVESKSATFPSEKARHLLDDSVLESRSPRRGPALASSSAVTNGLSLGKRLWLRTAAWHSRVCSCLCVTVPHPVAPPRREGSLRSHPARGSASWPLGLSSSCRWPRAQTGGRSSQTHTRDPPSLAGSWQSLAAALQGSVPGEPQAPASGQNGEAAPGQR